MVCTGATSTITVLTPQNRYQGCETGLGGAGRDSKTSTRKSSTPNPIKANKYVMASSVLTSVAKGLKEPEGFRARDV